MIVGVCITKSELIYRDRYHKINRVEGQAATASRSKAQQFGRFLWRAGIDYADSFQFAGSELCAWETETSTVVSFVCVTNTLTGIPAYSISAFSTTRSITPGLTFWGAISI